MLGLCLNCISCIVQGRFQLALEVKLEARQEGAGICVAESRDSELVANRLNLFEVTNSGPFLVSWRELKCLQFTESASRASLYQVRVLWICSYACLAALSCIHHAACQNSCVAIQFSDNRLDA